MTDFWIGVIVGCVSTPVVAGIGFVFYVGAVTLYSEITGARW